MTPSISGLARTASKSAAYFAPTSTRSDFASSEATGSTPKITSNLDEFAKHLMICLPHQPRPTTATRIVVLLLRGRNVVKNNTDVACVGEASFHAAGLLSALFGWRASANLLARRIDYTVLLTRAPRNLPRMEVSSARAASAQNGSRPSHGRSVRFEQFSAIGR